MTEGNDKEKKGFSGLSDLVSDIGKFDDQVASKQLSEPETQPLSSAQSSEITSPLSESGQKNRETSQVKESVANDETGRSSVRKWIWITVAVFFAIWFFSNEREGTKNTTHRQTSATKADNLQLGRPTSDVTKINGQGAGLHYEKPPIGTNNVLSFPQICWCLREDIRIETMRNLIDTKEGIDEFNRIVDDYNIRCVEFQYRKGSLKSAQRKVEENRNQIVSESITDARLLSRSFKSPNEQSTREVQHLLTELSYDPGPIDGKYGRKTADAIKSFQKEKGFSQDGVIDEKLLKSLREAKTASMAKLETENPSKSRFFVTTTPPDAKVRILNISQKYHYGIKLDPGNYHVEVSKNGYKTDKRWVKIVELEDTYETFTLEKNSEMETNIDPPSFINSINMEFVRIREGSFIMGSSSSEPGRYSDETQHRVTLTKPFYLQTTEVTQGQWKAVMGNNPSHFSNCGDDCPVEEVSWHDCQEFIRKLNQKEGTNKYRLPREAEWEYACRAGTIGPYYTDLDQAGWYSGNSGGRTHLVAQKAPNVWGLYDMHGNVWEWCQDWERDYPSGSVTDPEGPASGTGRVLRGGSWYCDAGDCRSAIRDGYTPVYRGSDDFGFRVAWTP